MASWTLPVEQWELVRDVIVAAVGDADHVHGVLLEAVVSDVEARLGDHPAWVTSAI